MTNRYKLAALYLGTYLAGATIVSCGYPAAYIAFPVGLFYLFGTPTNGTPIYLGHLLYL